MSGMSSQKGPIILTDLGKLRSAFSADGILLACLFGSALAGERFRDVDIAVLFQHYDFAAYLDTLAAVQRVLAPQPVDLVVLNLAPAPLKLRALLEGELLFARSPAAFVSAVTDALYEFEDYRRFLAEFLEYFDRRCREGLSVAERKMDRERVDAYLATLDEAVGHLRRLHGRVASFEEFRADIDTRELCVHYLRIALESVLDICRHFLAVVGVRLAEVETANLIELAGERGLLDPALVRKTRGMAGMRNAIVHVYTRLDYAAIYQAITTELTDFDEFARQVRARLGRKP